MDWQAIAVTTLVLMALFYLLRRAYQGFRRPSCGNDCVSCPSKDNPLAKRDDLVQIRIKKKS